jgi:hypothetical protein
MSGARYEAREAATLLKTKQLNAEVTVRDLQTDKVTVRSSIRRAPNVPPLTLLRPSDMLLPARVRSTCSSD